MKLFLKFNGRGVSALSLAIFAIAGLVVAAPKVGNTVIKDFAVPEKYDAPNEKQLKTLLEGAEAEPQPGGFILIRNVKWQSFAETGQTQLVVKAPACVLDSVQRSVSSDGRLEAVIGDGRFFIEGEGFSIQQTNLVLNISMRVHSVIHNAT
jgi:hypothetical protein